MLLKYSGFACYEIVLYVSWLYYFKVSESISVSIHIASRLN